MAKAPKKQRQATGRYVKVRRRPAQLAHTRLQLVVPAEDAEMVKAVAATLRDGGSKAASVRDSLSPLVHDDRVRTGAELLTFFRTSPLVGVDLSLKRETSSGRSADLTA